ncbi:unnamed protein product [Urochloa decumbens]|uniref:RRM domain-containing protein n=1 Tax=Urochloa decumbens TaxID=240449 RepID=A0ABC9G507_9POAL
MRDHLERFCPYNYVYGRFDSDSCTGGCPPAGPGQHRITSRAHRKFLRCLVRVSNLPPGFRERDIQELFGPFGSLPMWDVPRFQNDVCGCSSDIRMRFGVVVFKKRADGERAINELNGYEGGGCKLRVDWAYPSCV